MITEKGNTEIENHVNEKHTRTITHIFDLDLYFCICRSIMKYRQVTSKYIKTFRSMTE